MADSEKKTCFVIAPIGEPGSETRERSDEVLQHIICPVVEPLGYETTRADQINQQGVITSQVIQRIVDDTLVIADLTSQNPNVFYELAIRHAIAKPFIQIITSSEEIPFDLAGTRTIFINLQSLSSAEGAKSKIKDQIALLESNPSGLETPFTVAMDVQQARQSGGLNERLIAQVMAALSDIRTIDSPSIEALSATMERLEQAIRRSSSQLRLAAQRTAGMIARENDGAYDFIVGLTIFQNNAPWLFTLGMEVFRQAMDGNIVRAKEIYRELERLAEVTGDLQSRPMDGIMSSLSRLFNRLIHGVDEEPSRDDLPF